MNYPHLDGDVPRATSYGVNISQLIRFARACTSVENFNNRNRVITGRLLKQGYRYDNSKYKCSLKTLLRQGIWHPEFYGDVIYKHRKILGHIYFKHCLLNV